MNYLIEIENGLESLNTDETKELEKELSACNWSNWSVGDIFYSESLLSFNYPNLFVKLIEEGQKETKIKLKEVE